MTIEKNNNLSAPAVVIYMYLLFSNNSNYNY